MEITVFDNVREIMIESMRKKMLIPILGSGFTRKCGALRGKVPSGEDYRLHMIDTIKSNGNFTPEELDLLKSMPFSKISSVYHKEVSNEKQHNYLRDNFTHVLLDPGVRTFS